MTLDFEKVYAQAESADFWRIMNSFDGDYTYETVKESDARYADFKAWRERSIVYCNMSRRPYYETMPVQPDRLLQDFVKAFHPELLPDYEPTYYELLK